MVRRLGDPQSWLGAMERRKSAFSGNQISSSIIQPIAYAVYRGVSGIQNGKCFSV
jgi:hypothetical protein